MSTEKKTWYKIEVLYNYRGEIKRFEYLNCDVRTLHVMREQIISEGLMLPVSSDQWLVVLPWSIDCLTVWRQEKFYYDTDSNLNRTVFSINQKDKQ